MKSTPATASSGPAKKKARLADHEAGPSSSSAAAPPAAARRPSRAAASAANQKMDALLQDGSAGASDLLVD